MHKVVKCERIFPAPASLATEAKKGKNGKYNSGDVIEALKQVFHGKCYICEMQNLQDGEVEHLLPHHNSASLGRKFDWENLFWSCGHCNRMKNHAEYEGNVIDCCKEDPEEYLNCIYANGEVLVRVRNSSEKARLTAQLIFNAFNQTNTGIRKNATTIRKQDLQQEMTTFFQQLGVYQKDKTNVAKRKVAARLRTKTAFAAFKRDYIRAHQSEYPEFQEYV